MIFISYSSKDAKSANAICEALEAQGIKCWMAERDVAPGENYQEAIVRAIRGAKVLAVIFTANANESNEIKKELVLASRYNLTVVPVRIEKVEPSDAFLYELSTRQWVDVFDDWNRGIERLVAHVRTLLPADAPGATETVAAPPPPPRVQRPAPPPPAAAPSGYFNSWTVMMVCGLVPIALLVAVHYLTVIEFDLRLVYLRLLSWVVIPLPFGFLLNIQSRARVFLALAMALAIALVSTSLMVYSVAVVDNVPILPQSRQEWMEGLTFIVSVVSGFIAGYVLAGLFPASQSLRHLIDRLMALLDTKVTRIALLVVLAGWLAWALY